MLFNCHCSTPATTFCVSHKYAVCQKCVDSQHVSCSKLPLPTSKDSSEWLLFLGSLFTTSTEARSPASTTDGEAFWESYLAMTTQPSMAMHRVSLVPNDELMPRPPGGAHFHQPNFHAAHEKLLAPVDDLSFALVYLPSGPVTTDSLEVLDLTPTGRNSRHPQQSPIYPIQFTTILQSKQRQLHALLCDRYLQDTDFRTVLRHMRLMGEAELNRITHRSLCEFAREAVLKSALESLNAFTSVSVEKKTVVTRQGKEVLIDVLVCREATRIVLLGKGVTIRPSESLHIEVKSHRVDYIHRSVERRVSASRLHHAPKALPLPRLVKPQDPPQEAARDDKQEAPVEVIHRFLLLFHGHGNSDKEICDALRDPDALVVWVGQLNEELYDASVLRFVKELGELDVGIRRDDVGQVELDCSAVRNGSIKLTPERQIDTESPLVKEGKVLTPFLHAPPKSLRVTSTGMELRRSNSVVAASSMEPKKSTLTVKSALSAFSSAPSLQKFQYSGSLDRSHVFPVSRFRDEDEKETIEEDEEGENKKRKDSDPIPTPPHLVPVRKPSRSMLSPSGQHS